MGRVLLLILSLLGFSATSCSSKRQSAEVQRVMYGTPNMEWRKQSKEQVEMTPIETIASEPDNE